MWTKICGTTSLDDAQLAAELGADAIGFVFAASKRQVTAEHVAAITPRLPSAVEKVGVFDRPDAAWIVETSRVAELTAVQLHFALDFALLRELQQAFEGRVKLIQVVSVPVVSVPAVSVPIDSAGDEFSRVRYGLTQALRRPEIFAVLLDAARGGQSGGLGEAFSWDAMAPVLAEAHSVVAPEDRAPHLLLAGGLRPENVEAAVQALQPWGVDVVSGVEAAPGVKSPERLSRFLQLTHNL